jgi:hypothetical protein
MLDAALFPGAPPASIVVTTGQQIPGGVDNSAAGNEFNISYLFFDIDGDLPPATPTPEFFYDLRIRTATFVGGQIVFDGFHHSDPATLGNGSYVVTKNENSYLNFPFFDGEIIGDGVDEFVRDQLSPPGPPNNNTFSVGLDEGGLVRFFAEGVDNFLGFKLDGGFYGWIRVQFDSTAGGGAGSLTFLDGAYDNTGAPIAAGSLVPGPANANFDGDADVDGQDFLAWQRGFGLAGVATPADGDANLDLNVNGIDFNIWKDQFGEPLPPAAAVPEPSTAGLAVWCAIVLSAPRRRP